MVAKTKKTILSDYMLATRFLQQINKAWEIAFDAHKAATDEKQKAALSKVVTGLETALDGLFELDIKGA